MDDNLDIWVKTSVSHYQAYCEIIDFRKDNPLPEDQYGENHHIKPKSIYPELKDDKDNIVRLSGAEHFMAHYHLWKYYKDELKNTEYARKMVYAFNRMISQIKHFDNLEV